jgi:hypothetical protein
MHLRDYVICLSLRYGFRIGPAWYVHVRVGPFVSCWVISEDRRLDGQELDLETAIGAAVDSGPASLLPCVPGRLALFLGEDETLLLSN